MSEITPKPPEAPRSHRHRDIDTTGWIAGALLILVGIAFLLQNAGYVTLTGNWWALFIYAAAAGSFANAWRSYYAKKEFGSAANGSLIWGLIFTVVATIFMFNLQWDRWWPAILIAIGVGMVVGHMLRARLHSSAGTLDG